MQKPCTTKLLNRLVYIAHIFVRESLLIHQKQVLHVKNPAMNSLVSWKKIRQRLLDFHYLSEKVCQTDLFQRNMRCKNEAIEKYPIFIIKIMDIACYFESTLKIVSHKEKIKQKHNIANLLNTNVSRFEARNAKSQFNITDLKHSI